ncbi:small ribosomal subunit protein mS29 isoform X2 [Ahaetulla prasina]|nr:small ribosomal subunit protein mS29 isoform X2 [Ahaetulla prasina]XP_058015888.1 small ribosomal subunit protein mS29 isoform X2 [Ahaetulla prasina]XP_058015889.1 small ribosomal subunit protein mS29 isoform X2 [Ahaetulla prasina]XP_058015890.1 small ribosomal subunit protein mS29 isoform X2 [Ahaetulla prasina]XP_058015892.1 small ribosomal subunit protein mS29 isoform X2 [Ahaetulla prasina]XP_058015893.1 small ribosomal subunit protein mS29 isoform X2 [Ahaetulla prasina]XP_058015894.1 sm
MLRTLRKLIPWGYQLEQDGFLYCRTWQRTMATQNAQLQPEILRAAFVTSENDPAKHSGDHVGQYYTISPEEVKETLPHGLPARFKLQMKTFNEACVMVRQPAVELISYLKHTNLSHPAVRYLLYGEKSTGKTMVLCHAVHYCARQNWVIVHIPDAHLWVKNCKELLPSSYNSERLDQPVEAANWLKNFRITNGEVLSQIKTQQKYIWGKRDVTEEGCSLIDLTEKGLAWVKYASDVVGVILKELKQQSCQGSFRLLVAVDGINSLWGKTALKHNKQNVSVEELTLIHNLRKMVDNDWTGGAIVATFSQTGAPFTPRPLYLPHELLGREGFAALDPFVPIEVCNYTDAEFESCYQYYLERKWLQHEKANTKEGRLELRFLSGRNPGLFERLSAFL